mmetsp:Transcript_18616/g.22808  ORF Transcript_18616/g.22808 Transcript_18616/m.22808 type:complete len:616 (-) Transcript_18616:122-1969(-)
MFKYLMIAFYVAFSSSSHNIILPIKLEVPLQVQAFQVLHTQHHLTYLPSTARSSFTSRFPVVYHHTSNSNSNHSKSKNNDDSKRRSQLSMHMGHSHAHHHHNHDQSQQTKKTNKLVPAHTTTRGKILHQLSKRGRVTSILFAAAATLLPVLLFRQRSINRTDIVLFAMTSTALSLTNRIRTETKHLLKKAKGIRDGLIKHSPSSMSASKYLFQNDNAADRVTLVGVVINLLLSIGKGAVGITCHSSALVADAGHSLSDLFSDFITLWAVQIARLPPDDDHPYGHGKFEAVGSLFLALTLFATGLSVGASSNSKLLNIMNASASGQAVSIPTPPALLMAFMSIVSKEWLYRITKTVGEQLNSQVVIANAWHHRSDAYSSILAMGSIGLAMSIPGMVAADAAAGLLVAGMICMTGAEIMGEAVKQLTDTNDEALVERVKSMTLELSDDIVEVKRIRARWMGSSAVVDLAVVTSETLSSSANKAVEEMLRYKILDEEPGVIDVDVHATSNSLTCPLLAATGHEERKSVQEIEGDARTLLIGHNKVQSVEGCTIHYQDTVLPTINASIKLKSQNSTICDAQVVAQELKELLESNDDIHSANIYLDLNSSPVRHRNMLAL